MQERGERASEQKVEMIVAGESRERKLSVVCKLPGTRPKFAFAKDIQRGKESPLCVCVCALSLCVPVCLCVVCVFVCVYVCVCVCVCVCVFQCVLFVCVCARLCVLCVLCV